MSELISRNWGQFTLIGRAPRRKSKGKGVKMKDKKQPRVFAIAVCAVLAWAVAAGRGRTRLPADNLSSAEVAAAKNAPQTGGRKRSSRRKRGAKPAKSEETKTQPAMNQTQQQPALPTS